MTEEANEHAQQAEANPSTAPAAPKFDPDAALIEESLRHEQDRGEQRVLMWREEPDE